MVSVWCVFVCGSGLLLRSAAALCVWGGRFAAVLALACVLPRSWLGIAAVPLAFEAPTSSAGLVVVAVVAAVAAASVLGCVVLVGWLPTRP